MFIEALRQTRRQNCGQTAVAMLAGKTIAEVEAVYGHGHVTKPWEHIKAVEHFGFYADEKGFVPFTGKLPELALVRIAYLKRTKGGKYSTSGKRKRGGHLIVWANGQFYDPCRDPYTPACLPPGIVIDTVLEVLAP